MGYDVLVNQGLEALGRYYSRYRGIVVDNDDPYNMNRVKVAIPDVHGGIILWAEPVNQAGTTDGGFKYLTPNIRDIVWVSFENGNPAKPLWEYHGWALGEIPEELAKPNVLGLVTPKGNKIFLDEDDGGLVVYTNGNILICNKDGDIQLTPQNGSVIINPKEGFFIGDGANGGMVNVDQLTEKLNQLQQELEQFRTLFNSHVHTCASQGSPTTPTATPASTPFSEFNSDDYEDKTFLH